MTLGDWLGMWSIAIFILMTCLTIIAVRYFD
jgi:hypothetical protein